MSYISLVDVSKSFDDKIVLNRFSMSLEKGKSLCIMGPSGCGKTTIINLLLGFVKPDSGTINAPNTASVVFQEDRLCEDFSALSNVRISGACKNLCLELLNEMGISSEAKKAVKTFSGGMKRRVAIARALAAEADFYIFDEPFKGLDEKTKLLVIDSVKRRLDGKTFILITHDRDESDAFNAPIIELSQIN